VVIVGVMVEATAADATKALDKHRVPWRNWLDLRDEDSYAPIANPWLPSAYVLDRAGKSGSRGWTRKTSSSERSTPYWPRRSARRPRNEASDSGKACPYRCTIYSTPPCAAEHSLGESNLRLMVLPFGQLPVKLLTH
jgi:hypothetical protein